MSIPSEYTPSDGSINRSVQDKPAFPPSRGVLDRTCVRRSTSQFVSPVLALLRLSDFSLDRPFRLSLHVVGIPPCLALLGWGTTRREKRCPLISLRNFIPPIGLKIGMEVEKGISRRVVVVSGQNSSSLSRKLRNTTPESRFLPISNYKTYPLDSQLAQNRLRGILEYVLGLGGCRGGPSTPRGLEG
jgi:hypothetical protein